MHFPLCHIDCLDIRFGEGYVELLAFFRHNQQRRFAGAELNIFDVADLAAMIEYGATDQIADERPSRVELCAFCARKLQLRSDQKLCVRHRIDAYEFQNQQAFMRPQAFDL